jgi:hypothetical protein
VVGNLIFISQDLRDAAGELFQCTAMGFNADSHAEALFGAGKQEPF